MATQSTGGGSTTSFTNTPQAKDDVYNYLEDLLVSDSTIYNATTNTVTLDVMSNDLGGNAKTLFSVEDGDGNALTADYDLLAKDVNAAGCSPWEETLNHNWVRINNGKIEYRIADASGIPGRGVSVDSLTAGQDFNDQFVYAIRLGNGTLSEATVKIHITGANDAATISAVSAETAAVEAGGDANAIPGDPSAAGQLAVADADAGETKFQAPPSLNGAYGTFTFDANTGEWTYSLDNGLAATEGLNQGDHVTDTLTVKSFDGTATYTITVNITGTNDDPVASADVAVATEDGSTVTGSVATNDHDVDSSAILGFTVNGAPPAGFVMAADGSWTFDPTDSAYDHIAQGEHEDVVVSYTVTDEHGASDTATLTITVNGVNDDPEAGDDTGSGNEDSLISGSVADNDDDADDGASLAYALVDPAPAGLTFNPDGSWSLDASDAAYQHIAQGAHEDVVVSYTVTDEHGASDTATLTITVNGVNDDPALTGTQAVLAGGTEDNAYIVSAADLLAGFTDADGDTLSVSGLSADHGSVVNNGDGTYTITPTLNYNGAVVLSYNVVDGHGGSVAATETFNLAPVNDPAVISGAVSGSVTEDAVPNTVSGNLNSTDVDGVNDSWNAIVAATASTNGYGTYTMDAAGNWVYAVNNANPAVNALNDGGSLSDSFTVTTADGTSQVVNITINGHTDAVAVTLPPTFNGTGDPNDFDNLGNPAGQNTSSDATNDNDTLYGGAGNDTINGGGGDDTIYGGSGGDSLGGGADGDHLYGGSGSDTISGGNNNDLIIGGYGADTLTGNNGNDTFIYLDLKDTNDTITDFNAGDKIDFSAIDADPLAGGDQGFAFGGTTATAHGVWYAQVGGNAVVYVDTDGNAATAELSVTLTGVTTLGSGDFLLGP